jgi:putative ABC transport system substrate-binding protein
LGQGPPNAVDTFINSRRFELAAGAAKHKLQFVYGNVERMMASGILVLGPGLFFRAPDQPSWPAAWER